MNIYLKALAAGALALGLAHSASASSHVSVGIYAAAPRTYYPPVVQVQPGYAPAPVYYEERGPYAGRGRHARRHDWREEQWRREQWLRREEWRRQQWRREQWRRHHWQDH